VVFEEARQVDLEAVVELLVIAFVITAKAAITTRY